MFNFLSNASFGKLEEAILTLVAVIIPMATIPSMIF